jgi:hypothetical protein
MGMMGSRARIGWGLAVIGAFALVGACSLNPQPIPPGETDGTNQTADGGAPTNATGGGADDGGDGKGADATVPVAPDDAGDAGDAGDLDASDSGDT